VAYTVVTLVWFTLILVLMLAGAMVIAASLRAAAMMLLRPARMTEGRAYRILGRTSPADLGLRFEPTKFVVQHTSPAVGIDAWWIPAATASDRTVVIVHGFADSRIGGIAWAGVWLEMGFNVLAVDLRAHGTSQGKFNTNGFLERHDLDCILNDLRAARPGQTKVVMLFGASLGAAVSLATAGLRDDLAGVVCDSVYDHLRTAALRHGRLIAAPIPSLQHLAVRWAERIAGADFDVVAPVNTIPKARCPVMLVIAGQDLLVPPASQERLAQSLQVRRNARDVCWNVADAEHVTTLAQHPLEYRAQLRRFVEKVCATGFAQAQPAAQSPQD
jgi:uncharacterized protein